jgi:hypothetical protein
VRAILGLVWELSKWWSIRDINITFGDDLEYETKEIRELLDESENADVEEPTS